MMRPPPGPSLVAALLLVPVLLQAQSIWSAVPPGTGALGIEWIRASVKDNTFDTFDGVWRASGTFRLSDHRSVVIGVPIFRAQGSSSSGNPYLGVEQQDEAGKEHFKLGVFLPLADDGYSPGQGLALLDDFDRYEEMLAHVITLRAEGEDKVWSDSSGADVRIRAGGSFQHYTGEGAGTGGNSLIFNYGVRFGHRWEKLDLGVDVTGRFILSGDGGGFADRNFDQASIGLAWRGRVVPSVALRIPVTSNLKSGFDRVLTFGLALPIQ